jgi:ElaB/YqjD/DUF883 family membrane-anchored ribosome-binding protein
VTAAQQQVGVRASELREDASFRLREQIHHRSLEAGEQVQAVGAALRSGVEELRRDGKGAPADLVDSLASKADQLGDYLRRADADRIIEDVEAFARRRPWLTAGIGAAAGLMASRFLKASSDRRYDRTYGDGRYSEHGVPA